MKPFLLASALALAALSSVAMAGTPEVWRFNRHSEEPAFAPSKRALSIWASGACWSECGSHTTWSLVACIERDTQGRCFKRADADDRACQRACRTRGGPFLPIDTLFPLGD